MKSPRPLRLFIGIAALCLAAWGCDRSRPETEESPKARSTAANEALARPAPTNDLERSAPRVQKSDAEAQYELGLRYQEGDGVPMDKEKAVACFRRAAEQGNAAAQNRMGIAYSTGDGVPTNSVEAVKWYRRAAEQGDVDGEHRLGIMYEIGEGVDKDDTESVKWIRKAAEQGDAYGQAALGDAYRDGRGVVGNFSEAVKWYRKVIDQSRGAAEQGEVSAQCLLGRCYADMNEKAEAVKWYRRAAEQGNFISQFNLGWYYMKGEGVPEDDIEALKWLNIAAAHANGFEEMAKRRDSLVQSMSRAEIVEAQRRASAFVARKELPKDLSDSNLPTQAGFEQKASGTGFFISEDGYLLTALHVVSDAARIAVKTEAGTFPATLVKADKADDVALLKVNGKFHALPVAPSRGMKLGETVFTIGFPNIELQGYAAKLTRGEISSLTGLQDDPREFQISVPVQPGNSGGPLVNQCGNVVGIVEAQLADIATLKTTGSLPQNVNYALKSSLFNALLESLPEVSAKLKEPNSKVKKFEDATKDAENAIALVLVY